jgi:uncharacterized protein YcbK (DUF882 family)
MSRWKNFPDAEFAKCSPPCKLDDMQPHFMNKMQEARGYSTVPFRLTSAYRTVEHELKQGRTGASSHTKGVAVDIAFRSNFELMEIVQGLIRAGFRRIFINWKSNFVHVDSDSEKVQSLGTY